MSFDTDDCTLTEGIVLLGVADLAVDGETPVLPDRLTRVCNRYADEVDAEVVGRLSEATVARWCNRFEADGTLAHVETDEPSPVGRGRPAFDLAAGVDETLSRLQDDERLTPVVERIDAGR